MKRNVRGHRVPAVLAAATGVLALPFAAPPVQAAPPAGGVEFRYAEPEFAESGNRITWRWTVRNTGGKAVDGVVLTHALSPRLKVTSVSAPCKAREESITCDYRALRAGGQERGSLVAELPADTAGSVRIKGRVTWRQGTAPVTDTTAPSGQAAPGGETGGAKPDSGTNPAAPGAETTTPDGSGSPKEGSATGALPPERDEGPEPRPNGNAVPQQR
jgi:uncharacterized repeat protein (TIGR01451 family)